MSKAKAFQSAERWLEKKDRRILRQRQTLSEFNAQQNNQASEALELAQLSIYETREFIFE